MESVKQRMLSRRSFFRAAAVGTAGIATAGMGIAPPALAAGHTSVTDLTHELYEEFPTYFGQQQFFREQKFNYAEHKFNLFELRVNDTLQLKEASSRSRKLDVVAVSQCSVATPQLLSASRSW
jgi:hypothetical protein